jgi:hypothetical protein
MAEDSGAFQEFWHHYLHEHAHVGTRALHYAGTIIGLFGVTIAALTLTLGPALNGIVLGYLLAWTGHFFIERNRPCAFTHPLWSFVSNMRMLRCWITGDLDPSFGAPAFPPSSVRGAWLCVHPIRTRHERGGAPKRAWLSSGKA